jgi:hypothetical protein
MGGGGQDHAELDADHEAELLVVQRQLGEQEHGQSDLHRRAHDPRRSGEVVVEAEQADPRRTARCCTARAVDVEQQGEAPKLGRAAQTRSSFIGNRRNSGQDMGSPAQIGSRAELDADHEAELLVVQR